MTSNKVNCGNWALRFKKPDLVRAERGGKSKSGGTNTIGGGGSAAADHKFPITHSLTLFPHLINYSKLNKRRNPVDVMQYEWMNVWIEQQKKEVRQIPKPPNTFPGHFSSLPRLFQPFKWHRFSDVASELTTTSYWGPTTKSSVEIITRKWLKMVNKKCTWRTTLMPCSFFDMSLFSY